MGWGFQLQSPPVVAALALVMLAVALNLAGVFEVGSGVQHAGYGLGFERIVMYVTGIANIRDVLPFPRTASSMDI